eukprot:2529903-Amphidinium_carterae.1
MEPYEYRVKFGSKTGCTVPAKLEGQKDMPRRWQHHIVSTVVRHTKHMHSSSCPQLCATPSICTHQAPHAATCLTKSSASFCLFLKLEVLVEHAVKALHITKVGLIVKIIMAHGQRKYAKLHQICIPSCAQHASSACCALHSPPNLALSGDSLRERSSTSARVQKMGGCQASVFGDESNFDEILAEPMAHKCKAQLCTGLGRKCQNFDNEKWLEVVEDVAYEVVLQKFSASEELAEVLLSTGNKIIAE